LRDVKDISMHVLLIVAEHHENAMGLGYPKKQRDIKTSPLAKIVAVGNQMTELMFSFKGGKIYSPDEAVKYIEDVLGQPYNKQVFLALKNILNKKALADKAS
jgi:HD-GYP domain-containing protein (c-di-GMP phosphodiesterase class II)